LKILTGKIQEEAAQQKEFENTWIGMKNKLDTAQAQDANKSFAAYMKEFANETNAQRKKDAEEQRVQQEKDDQEAADRVEKEKKEKEESDKLAREEEDLEAADKLQREENEFQKVQLDELQKEKDAEDKQNRIQQENLMKFNASQIENERIKAEKKRIEDENIETARIEEENRKTALATETARIEEENRKTALATEKLETEQDLKEVLDDSVSSENKIDNHISAQDTKNMLKSYLTKPWTEKEIKDGQDNLSRLFGPMQEKWQKEKDNQGTTKSEQGYTQAIGNHLKKKKERYNKKPKSDNGYYNNGYNNGYY